MCNRLSKRNRPYMCSQDPEKVARVKQWRHDWIHGKNKYRLHMIEESNRAFEGMIGNNTRSNIVKFDEALAKGKNTCHLRPSVVKFVEKLNRYWHASYHGKLKG